MSDLPAMFVGGPHNGEVMHVGGTPGQFYFPVYPDFSRALNYDDDGYPVAENFKTVTYDYIGTFALYRYKGRY